MPQDRSEATWAKTQPVPSLEKPPATLYVNVEGFAKSKESRNNAEDPGDVVKEIPGGAILLDGAGGEGAGDDWKAAKVVGQKMAEYISMQIRQIEPNPIQNGDVKAVRETIVGAFRIGSETVQSHYRDGSLKQGATTTANVAIIVRTPRGRVLVSGNTGDSSTFIRNRRSGEIRAASVEHSTVASLKAAGIKLTGADELARRHEVYRFVNSVNPASPSDQIAQFIGLTETLLSHDEDVFITSDGVTDNMEAGHLLDLSTREAKLSGTTARFVRRAFDVARDISLAGISARAKPDDYSAVAISTEYK